MIKGMIIMCSAISIVVTIVVIVVLVMLFSGKR